MISRAGKGDDYSVRHPTCTQQVKLFLRVQVNFCKTSGQNHHGTDSENENTVSGSPAGQRGVGKLFIERVRPAIRSSNVWGEGSPRPFLASIAVLGAQDPAVSKTEGVQERRRVNKQRPVTNVTTGE